MELILLRHSIAVGNERHVFLGRTDTPLCARGVAFARARASAVPNVMRVYSSPLMRARQTAELIWPGVESEAVAGIREMDFGLFDGYTHAENMENPVYREWLAKGCWDGYPGGDTFEGTRERCAKAMEYIVLDAEKRGLSLIGCAAHGGSLMMIAELYSDIRTNFTDKLIKNCHGFRMSAHTEQGKLAVTAFSKI